MRQSEHPLHGELRAFNAFGKQTDVRHFSAGDAAVPVYVNEFWTAKQRAANRLHEVSYRACFKPQLPRFFIERLTRAGEAVFDPFMGRGTTLLEAALLGRIPLGCDANPLCGQLVAPRLTPPTLDEVRQRLSEIDFNVSSDCREDLLVFYHPSTLRQIASLRAYLTHRSSTGTFDSLDAWIRMVALNRLTGHSAGFFSVYSLPPNQAVTIESQQKINIRLKQSPPSRDVPAIILKKSKSLLGGLDGSSRKVLASVARDAIILAASCQSLPAIPAASAALAVTSPPFLDVVDYATDNWLRCWFAGLEPGAISLSIHRKPADWQESMRAALAETCRILRPGGWVAFEVGEVQRGRILLDELVIPAGAAAGLIPELVLINAQKFTKTANCWGVRNNDLGTNTNRIVLFRKPPNPAGAGAKGGVAGKGTR